MAFKRSSSSYGRSPFPETPYQKAGQVWDERIGSARVQAKNWRLMALGCLGLCFVTSGALVWRSMQSTVTPYVVEVDETGAARAVAPATTSYTPTDAQIAHHLANFIEHVRGLSVDPVVVRENWLRAYDFVTDRAATTLNEYASANDPFADVGRKSRRRPMRMVRSSAPKGSPAISQSSPSRRRMQRPCAPIRSAFMSMP
jgi:type IV secretory pathway TrbF-like protein